MFALCYYRLWSIVHGTFMEMEPYTEYYSPVIVCLKSSSFGHYLVGISD